MTTKLTKVQQVRLDQLKTGPFYVSYGSPVIMRTFEKLVEKGLAKVAEVLPTGKKYQAI